MLKKYFQKFEQKFKDLEKIDAEWYLTNCGVKAFCKSEKTKDTAGKRSEEWFRARMVWVLVNSGMYNKEYICVEFALPKGSKGAKPVKPDIVVFKNKEWANFYEEAQRTKNFSKIRQIILVVFEAKKQNKTVEETIERQLRPVMAENESKDRIFGVYFDGEDDILIFKKIGNSELIRFNEEREISQDGLKSWNLSNRDLLSDLLSQKDFAENNKSISDLEKLKLTSLDAIDEKTFSNFMNELKRANDYIKPTHAERDLIVEFLTLKIFDEKRSKSQNSYLQFYILESEKRSDGLAERSFRERINKLYKDARIEYGNVLSEPLFSYNANFKPSSSNDERFLIALVQTFQKRAILKAKNESFNQIIFNNFGDDRQKSDKGQFFTPIPLVKTIIKMLNPIKGEELCDPCCGICDFPAMAFKHSYRKEPEYPDSVGHFYGFDLYKNNLKLAELNLVLNGDGGATLRQMDSLAQKLLDNGQVMERGYFTVKNYEPKNWENVSDPSKEIKKYKIIATNPPFGKGRDLKTGQNGKWDLNKETIELYETWKAKPSPNKQGKTTLPKSMDMGVLFLENAYKSLEQGGRLGIVLSNSIASIKEWENVRQWIISKMRIVAMFDLPANTFGETGVATTIIIAYKPKKDELNLLKQDYEVFVKEIRNIGYEVKTVQRTIDFKPQFIINEETFEKTDDLNEDFSQMIKDFKEFLKRQEEEIKNAFHLEQFD